MNLAMPCGRRRVSHFAMRGASRHPVSEPELRNELHLAAAHTRNGAGDLASMARADYLIGQSERGMVEDIRGTGAEVQLDTLRNTERFDERHVH